MPYIVALLLFKNLFVVLSETCIFFIYLIYFSMSCFFFVIVSGIVLSVLL